MKPSRRSLQSVREQAAALIIVLAFVVLLTGLVLAYFSRSTNERQLVQASFNDNGAGLLARSALDITVGDFKQEIVNGSTAASIPNVYYFPWTKTNGNPIDAIVPIRRGTTSDIPNLIRRSIRNDTGIWANWISSRASAVSSTEASANGRSVSLTRWNSHYLIPRDPSATGDDSTPINTFQAPDWVIVTRNGPATFGGWDPALKDASANNTTYAVGRYAYAVYDEGGLLDVNVAGYPAPTPAAAATPAAYLTDVGRKGVVTFADLTVLPTTGVSTVSPQAVNALVGFRNYATMGHSGISGLSFPYSSITAGKIGPYYLGPVNVAPWTSSDHVGTSRDFGMIHQAEGTFGGKTGTGSSTRTDQNFVTRTELIKFRSSAGIASVDTLQYLGTFSREKNGSTWRAGGITSGPIEANLAAPPTGPGRFYIGSLNSVFPTQTVQDGIGLQWKGKKGEIGYWSYNGPTGNNTLDHIPPFSGGAKHHLFKLLEYAMFGYDGASDSAFQFKTTLSVGASLIDQYDPNNDFAIYSNTGDTTGSYTTAIQAKTQGWLFGMEKNDGNIGRVVPTPPPATPTPIPSPLPNTIFLDHYLDSGAPVIGGRPFRGVGDFGYGIKTNLSGLPTLDFYSAASTDAPVLDFFTYNNADPASGGVAVRSGIVSLNTHQPRVLAAILSQALLKETTNNTVTAADALDAATKIVDATAVTPAVSRADIVRLASGVTNISFPAYDGTAASEDNREAIPRALAEVVQTRTWGLLIDLVAQTGHYAPNATGLADFIVEGEKRYWLHIAIDRFDGSIVGQQLEEVLE
jgi:hypothetical protein